MLLSAYQYDIQYKSTTEHGNADGLSRLPLPDSGTEDADAKIASLFNLSQLEILPITAKDIARETRRDRVLSHELQYTQDG